MTEDDSDRRAPICGAPCYYGGLSAVRKFSKSDLGWMWHCNRKVKSPGDRCWQHPRIDVETAASTSDGDNN